jgi:hypothetical protein
MRYLPGFFDFYRILEVELPYWDSDRNNLVPKKVHSTSEVLTSSQDPLSVDQHGRILLGKQHYFLGTYPETPSGFEKYGRFCSENSDELHFWVDYLNFFSAAVSLCQDLSSCIQYNAKSIFRDICGVLQDFLSIDLVDNSNNLSVLHCQVENYEKEDAKALALSERLNEVSIDIDGRLCRTLQLIGSGKLNNQEELFRALQNFFEPIGQLQQIAKVVEDNGSSMGSVLLGFPVEKIIEDVTSNIDEKDPKGDDLARLRDNLKIMNPMTEESWDSTKEDVEEMVQHCQSQLNHFITAIQGLDLLRQVLEHRFNEWKLIEAHLVSPGDWHELATKTVELVKDRAVTDQEKLTSSFYLDKFLTGGGDTSAAPGEVLLF